MRNLKISIWLLFIVLLSSAKLVAQPSEGYIMSEAELRSYLSKSIVMFNIADHDYYIGSNLMDYRYPASTLAEDIAMINDLRPRIVASAASLWRSPWDDSYHFEHARQNAENVHNIDETIIMQAAIFEYVHLDNNIDIPAYVSQAFGQSQLPRKFNPVAMAYTNYQARNKYFDDDGNGVIEAIVPSIDKVETKMWFYYRATQYIQRGYESIYFGDFIRMSEDDPLREHWWELLSKVRAYAAQRNRGFVLCTAHVSSSSTPYYNGVNATAQNYHLLFDYHFYPSALVEGQPYTTNINTVNPEAGKAYIESGGNGYVSSGKSPEEVSLYGKSPGGKTYMGWTCEHLPYVVDFDNGSSTVNPGQAATECVNGGANWWYLWGYDEITWYSLQSKTYRDEFLIYLYKRIKQLDKDGYLQFTGRRGTSRVPANGMSLNDVVYRANNAPENAVCVDGNQDVLLNTSTGHIGYFCQQTTIKNIWNGMYDNVNCWQNMSVPTIENTEDIRSNLLVIKKDIYYINSDGRIHAFIFRCGKWQDVIISSPGTILAALDANIVYLSGPASIEGIYFKGIDSRLHRSYFVPGSSFWVDDDLMIGAPQNVGNQLVAGNSRVFYQGTDNKMYNYVYNGGTWTQGVLNNSVSNVSNSANLVFISATSGPGEVIYKSNIDNKLQRFYYNGSSWLAQTLVTGSVTSAANSIAYGNNNIYYQSFINGQIYFYYLNMSNVWTYGGLVSNSVTNVSGDLTFTDHGQGTSARYIYYKGTDSRIYCVQNTGSGWASAALLSTAAQDVKGKIVIKREGDIFYCNTSDNLGAYFFRPCLSTTQPGTYRTGIIENNPFETYGKQGDYTDAISVTEGKAAIDKLTVCPNPSNGDITVDIQLNTTENASLLLINHLGKIIKQVRIYKGTSTLNLEDIDLANGLYYVRIADENGVLVTEKLIVTK